MLLRNHPSLRYHGTSSWPPNWTFTAGVKNERPPRDEIGILREVTASNIKPADRCFLHVEHEGSMYVGRLLIEDPVFCAAGLYSQAEDGLVPQLRRDVATKFKGLQIQTCPFANLPERKRTQWALTREEMKNCVWLKPELVTQIEFTEWTRDGHLRHSKLVGLREDKDPKDIAREAAD
jgi:hypothetical protein